MRSRSRIRSAAACAASLCVVAAAADAVVGVPAPSELTSQLLPASKAVVAEQGKFGEFKTMLCGETRSVSDLLTGVARIEPGQQIHPPHRHVEEEFLLLAKGSGTWHLDGHDSPAREGDLLYVAPWVEHGLTNTSDQPLTFVVVKWNGKGVAKAEKPEDGSSASKLQELKSSVLHRDDVKPDASGAGGPIGDVRRYVNGGATRSMSGVVTGVASLLAGKEVHPPHQHADEELLYVVKGRGTWHLDGKDVEAAAGDLLYTQPWTVHGVTASASEPLTFYVLKWNGRGVPAAEKPKTSEQPAQK
jgi:mannose-6-phosphate isomerase-like protein (cupin superfamily)